MLVDLFLRRSFFQSHFWLVWFYLHRYKWLKSEELIPFLPEEAVRIRRKKLYGCCSISSIYTLVQYSKTRERFQTMQTIACNFCSHSHSIGINTIMKCAKVFAFILFIFFLGKFESETLFSDNFNLYV